MFNLSKKEIKKINNIFRRGFTINPQNQNNFITIFESKFAKLIGVKYAIALSSGTMALFLTLLALKLNKDDEVIISSLSFISPLSAVLACRAKPILVDIDPYNFNINIKKIRDYITPKTRAVILVHLFGVPVEYNKLKKELLNYNIIVIEDCAQAAGAKYINKPVGSFGDVACFSFYTSKNLNCFGGGMVTTNKSSVYKKILLMSNYGNKNIFGSNFFEIGYNARMNEIQAILGIERIKYLEKNNKKRKKRADIYKNALSQNFKFQFVAKKQKPAYYLLAGILDKNKFKRLNKEVLHIGSMLPIYRTNLFKKYVGKVNYNNYKNTESVFKKMFYLKINPEIKISDIRKNIKYINSLIKK